MTGKGSLVRSGPVAEALAGALRERATGQLTATRAGRRSQLLIREGGLVGVRVGFGYQSLPQSLFSAGLIDAHALDAWWARGGGDQPDPEMLEVWQLDPGRCRELHALANLRSICEQAEDASFEPGPVEALFEPIPLEQVMASLGSASASQAEPLVDGGASWADLLEGPLPSYPKVGQR